MQRRKSLRFFADMDRIIDSYFPRSFVGRNAYWGTTKSHIWPMFGMIKWKCSLGIPSSNTLKMKIS